MAEEEENNPSIKSELASQAEQMGAVHKLDLTSDVTHLIVGDSNTPKYKYVARERPDVKVLTPDWIEAVRQLWIHDQEVDLQALEERYRLPVLAGLRICLTGIEECELFWAGRRSSAALAIERQRFQKLINEHGGEYHGDLTKTVTHLLAYKAEGEKYRHANMWGLKIVSLEWLMHSLERGMVLEEALYNPLTPQPERGRNAWIRKVSSTTTLGKRLSCEGSASDDVTSRRKLRRSASSKLQSQNSCIWGDIVGGGFEQHSAAGGFGGSGVKDDQHDKESLQPAPNSEVGQRTAQSAENVGVQHETRLHRENGDESSKVLSTDKHGLFKDKHFYLHGFDDEQVPRFLCVEKVESLHTTVEDQPHDTYIVVPHTYQKHQDLKLPNANHQPAVASEWWIEKCLYCKRVSDPRKHVLSRPFSRYPIPGANYDEFLTPNASVLICNLPLQKTEKMKHAFDWNIPCVSAKWLWDSIEREEKMLFEDYLVRVCDVEERLSTLPSLRRTPLDDGIENSRRSKSDVSGLKLITVNAKKGNSSRECVLGGCVVFVSKLLEKEEQKLRDLARSLGARVVDIPPRETDNAITHLIYKTSDNDPSEDTLASEMPGCQIVSPDWLHQCAKTESRLFEEPFLFKLPNAQLTDCHDSGPAENELELIPLKDATIPSPPSTKGSQDQTTPLQDIEPEVNSSKQPPSNAAQVSKTKDEPKPQQSKPPIPSSENLNDAIAALLARKQSATLSNKDNETTTTAAALKVPPPPPRLQGRASSTLSHTLSRGNSVEYDNLNNTLENNEHPQPSQRVLYEDPEHREHRERVIRKMGGTIETTGGPNKPRSIGVVKDMGGIGTRTRARTGLGKL
ncbi:MAG: hypothetical protein M1816_004768 [Peltula sp. TS41687]|nr:MAG: hypothetical protein M1816_004768 [Peltula sp. TS41687]